MSGRQGGKVKPLKAPKKATKELDEDDLALRKRLQDEKKALQDAQKVAAGKGPLGAGGKKIGKK